MADKLREAVERVERGENVQMTFSMPPRVGKSFTISTYTPAWLFDRNHSLRCGIISHSPSLASTWGRSVRRMVEEHGSGENGSGILNGLDLARDAKAVTNWETSQRGHLLSRSVKQALAGFGFQVLIVDDPVKDYISAHNEKYRDDMWEWWKTDVLSRMQDPYLLIVVGTRWHHDDLIGRILSDKYEGDPNDWEQIVFPAIATAESIDPVTGTDKLGRKVGEPLISPLVKDETPEQALVRWARIEENVGSSTWASLYQQSPTPDTGGIFDMSRVKFWTTEPGIYNGDPDNTILIDAPMLERMRGGYWVDSWDTSFKGGETSDFVVGQRWVRVGAFRFLIAQRRGRWGYNDTLHQMRQWSTVEANPGSLLDPSPFGRYVHRRVIEEKANGAALIESLSQDVSGIKAVNPKLGKEARARIITPEFESGHVVLPHPDTPGFVWVNSLYEELKGFPHSSHDDQVDALTQALAELRETPSVQVSDPSLSTQRIDRRYLTVEGAHAFRESASPSGMGGLSARIPGR